MIKKTYILFVVLFFSLFNVFSQENIVYQKGIVFPVSVSVVDEEDRKITRNTEIEANGRYYSFPNVKGNFIIKVKVGDEIRVSHPDFETVYYTIKSSEDIKVVVKDYLDTRKSSSKLKTTSKRIQTDFYLVHLDSATFYKNKNINTNTIIKIGIIYFAGKL